MRGLRRIWYLLNRRRLEREMSEEMAYHRELMAGGKPGDFGSDLRLLEDAREVWGWGWFDRLWQDLTYGARVLRRSPGFTLTAMLVLALGIGVPLTVFRQVLFETQGSSAPDPDTLVQLTRRASGLHSTVLPYPAFAFYAGHAQSFRQLIGVSQPYQAAFAEAEQIRVVFATANYFPEFGIQPAYGRFFATDDERPDAEPVALLGEAFWKSRMGGDPAVIGQTIALNGKRVRVAGIAPRSARNSADVWMPLARQPFVIEGSTLLTDWNSALDVFGRLKPGVSPKASEQETRALGARLHELRPRNVLAGEYLGARPILQFDPGSAEFLMGVTAAALVIVMLAAACANLGLLVLARGVAREREIRTRMALGAGRKRVVRQLATESLLLAGLSAACALVLSTLVLRGIYWQQGSTAVPGLFPGWGALGATAGMAVFAGLVFGLPAALRLTSGVPRGGRIRGFFLGAQVAASCLLLVISSLLVNGIQRVRRGDPGFDYQHLIWIAPNLKAHGYSGPAAQAYLEMLRQRTAAIPGVKSASAVWLAPWGDLHAATVWSGRQFATNHVDAKFLDTMGLQLVRGRNFLPGEEGVTIVTQSAARAMWPDSDPLGKRVPWDPHGPTVIGVLRDASTTAISATEPLEFYVPGSQGETAESVLVLRVSGTPRDSPALLREIAGNLDRRLQPVVQPLTDAYDRELEKVSRALAAITMLGGVALLLSSIGLAGLAGYTVAQRTREIGVRIALGARALQIVPAILAPMRVPIVAGFLCGVLGGSAAVRVLRSGMAGIAIPSFDPLAYLAAMLFFLLVMTLAVFAPARRAIRINPSRALQHE